MQLLASEAHAALLRQSEDAYLHLLDWLDRTVPPEHSHDLVAIHRNFYERARETSPLQARAVTLAFKDWVQRRRGKIVRGLPLDEKLYGLKGIERVSIATLNGRITIPFRVAGYGAEWNGKSPARLVETSDEGRFELLIAVGLAVVAGLTLSG